MMHFFAHFWFWFISIFIYLALVLVGDMPMTTAIGTILGIIILFCLLAFWIFSKGYRNGLVVYVLGLIGKIGAVVSVATMLRRCVISTPRYLPSTRRTPRRSTPV